MVGMELAEAVRDPGVVARYRAKIARVPGSGCWWWTSAVSGAGHGRFWMGAGRVVIAHRFGFALVAGVEALAAAEVLAHRCDNPLCQRVDAEHVVASTIARNRVEWSIRRHIAGLPLSDPRGARGRAVALRSLVRCDPAGVVRDQEALLARVGEQRPLFEGLTDPVITP